MCNQFPQLLIKPKGTKFPHMFTYNGIIKRFCKNDLVEDAYQLLDEKISRGVKLDI